MLSTTFPQPPAFSRSKFAPEDRTNVEPALPGVEVGSAASKSILRAHLFMPVRRWID
jgi:hypothetical protein